MEMNGSVIDQQRLDQARLEANGMYSSQFEKDACGMGFVVNIKGKKSHDIIDDGLRILERLEHRGGAGADKDTGDGAGILVQIPHEFFKRECEVLGISLPAAGEYGVGMIFAHKYESLRNEQKRIFEEVVREEGQVVLGWREVPVDGTPSDSRHFNRGTAPAMSFAPIQRLFPESCRPSSRSRKA